MGKRVVTINRYRLECVCWLPLSARSRLLRSRQSLTKTNMAALDHDAMHTQVISPFLNIPRIRILLFLTMIIVKWIPGQQCKATVS